MHDIMKSGIMSIKSIDWFENNRPEHYSFTRDEIETCLKHAIITAGVKVGKLELILIQARRTAALPKQVQHIFITNFKRKDCKEQRRELAAYDVATYYCEELVKVAAFVEKCLAKGLRVVIHDDESDFGTGSKQVMAPAFHAIRKIKDGVLLRLYSATNEEALYSEFAKECVHLVLPDPPSFFGPDDYLNTGRVTEAEPFWDEKNKRLTAQGEEACRYWVEQKNKPFSVLRINSSRSKDQNGITYSKLKHSKEFGAALANFGIETYFVNGNNEFYWGDREKWDLETGAANHWWMFNMNERRLFVVNQTCVRSTKVGFHPLIAFWHDYRNKTSTYTTVHQAQLRVVHYPYKADKYWENPTVDLMAYGCVKTFEFAAGRIAVDEYLNTSGRKLSTRIMGNGDVLSHETDDYEEIIVETEDELKQVAQDKFHIPLKPEWEVRNGIYFCNIRGVKKQWLQKEAEAERFYGLSKGEKSHRVLVYYTTEGIAKFRLMVHNGNIKTIKPTSKDTQYNKKKDTNV